MEDLFKLMAWDLAFAHRAEPTKRIYLGCVRAFAAHIGRSPAEVGQAEVRAWVVHLLEAGTSPSRLSQHLCALAFLFRRTIGRPEAVSFFASPRRAKRLPAVLAPEDVGRVLAAVASPRYRMLFQLMWATGLRIQEACGLPVWALDEVRGVIRVFGKGRRERLVGFPPGLRAALEVYRDRCQPQGPWLFPGKEGRCLHPDQARRVFRKAARAAGIAGRVTPHTLRHSHATALLERGTGLRVIQALLGHASLDSTAHYLRVCVHPLQATPDLLALDGSSDRMHRVCPGATHE